MQKIALLASFCVLAIDLRIQEFLHGAKIDT